MILLSKEQPYQQLTNSYIDDRGFFTVLDEGEKGLGLFNIDSDESIMFKRSYIVRNFQRNVVRGWHRHQIEKKMFVPILGEFKIIALGTREKEGFYVVDKQYTFIISDKKPSIVVVPENFWMGNMSLSNDAILLAFSTSTTKNSLADDIRLPANHFGDLWTVKSR